MLIYQKLKKGLKGTKSDTIEEMSKAQSRIMECTQKELARLSLIRKPGQDILCQDLSGKTACGCINPDKEEFFVADIDKDRLV
jgi:hypothetical protein